ncbi:MAG: hypothetical protein JWM64_2867 [Frankiales bacterium]|nr:hypothetical protein [Frankiales bacterium]
MSVSTFAAPLRRVAPEGIRLRFADARQRRALDRVWASTDHRVRHELTAITRHNEL